MFFLHILILYHLLEEVIFTLYYLYTTTTNLYGLLALLVTSGAGLTGIFFYKRRKMKKL